MVSYMMFILSIKEKLRWPLAIPDRYVFNV